VLDTKADPRNPELVKVIEGEEVMAKTGYAAPHTVHCGPDGIYMNALGATDGDGPGGIFILDHETFEVKGAWEKDRGPQYLSYDFWWHLGQDTMITSEWGTPNMVKDGVNPDLLLNGKYGHALHVWDLRSRRHLQTLDLGAEQQMVLELRPAHNPQRAYGFVGVVISLEDLSSSIFLWYLDRENGGRGEWKDPQGHHHPRRAGGSGGPAAHAAGLQGRAAPGHGHQPLAGRPLPLRLLLGNGRAAAVRRLGSVRARARDTASIGGIVNRTPHPRSPDQPLNGGPQMVEVSRDGRRVYLTNSLYTPWDAQFYPDGIRGWMAKFDVGAEGGLAFDPRFSWSSRTGCVPTRCAPGRRRLLRLVLLLMSTELAWPWIGLLLLGAVHGINPGMGWLFAVALGLQEQGRRAVWRALLPLAGGHAVAIGGVAVVAALLGTSLPAGPLKWGVAVLLLGFGVFKLFRSGHPRYGGMRVGAADLTVWSFLMASAHGAGLMILPLLLALTAPGGHAAHGGESGHAGHGMELMAVLPPDHTAALIATALHTAGYLLVTGVVAVVVYEKLGLRLLGKVWFNLDRVWAAALIATAVLTPLI
jgi:methanethiol oxidase